MQSFLTVNKRLLRILMAGGLFLSSAAALPAVAQHLPLNFLFRPNAWAGVEYNGPSEFDHGKVSLPAAYLNVTAPVLTRVAIDREPFDLSAHQIVAQFYARQQRIAFTGMADELPEVGRLNKLSSNSTTFAAGFTGLYGSLNKGIWAYGLRGTIVAGNAHMSAPYLTALAGVAKVKPKALHKGYIYGLGLFYSPDMIMPIPVLGGYVKPYREVTLYLILPVQAKASYRVNDKLTMAFISTIFSRPGVVSVQQSQDKEIVSRYSSLGLRSGLQASIRPHKHWYMYAEAGVLGPHQVSISHEKSYSSFGGPALYADFNVLVSFGDQVVETPLGMW